MGGLGRRCIRVASLGMVAIVSILAACDAQETPSTTKVVSFETTVVPTVQATATVVHREALPSSATTQSLVAASTHIPKVSSQVANLTLEVTTPASDAVVTAGFVTVAGLTSPDATVSVNGVLTLPDTQGHFSVDLTRSLEDNPLPVEVIASSLSGEQRSVVRTVIFVP